ncbi:histidine kinase [Brevibacillus agri]|uniref:histidine kinase n=1 Tax=Brevibacillus agri TaxID=51101 RepID=UPI002867F016|nr:histidine kinase [Brevibacillus agri]
MKKKLAMSVIALAVSAMAGSAFAADESTVQKAVATFPAKTVTVQNDGMQVPMQPVINLEQMAKEKGIPVDELLKQLEKEGKFMKAALTLAVPATEADSDKAPVAVKMVKLADATANSAALPAISLEENLALASTAVTLPAPVQPADIRQETREIITLKDSTWLRVGVPYYEQNTVAGTYYVSTRLNNDLVHTYITIMVSIGIITLCGWAIGLRPVAFAYAAASPIGAGSGANLFRQLRASPARLHPGQRSRDQPARLPVR